MARTKQPVQGRRADDEAAASGDGSPTQALVDAAREAPDSKDARPKAAARSESAADMPSAAPSSLALKSAAAEFADRPSKPAESTPRPGAVAPQNGNTTALQPPAAAQEVLIFRPQQTARPQPTSSAAGGPPASNFAVLDPGPGLPKAPLPKVEQLKAAPLASTSATVTATDSEGSERAESGTAGGVDPEWGSRRQMANSRAAVAAAQARSAPAIPAPPQGERRANRMWRQHLSDLLKIVLQNVKRRVGHSKAYPFLTQVDLSVAPDYHQFVKREDEMWLHHISDKLRALSYSSATAFRADLATIRRNCVAYNTPGCGEFGGTALLEWAQELESVCQQELEGNVDSIRKAEQAIADPECAPPDKETLPERAPAPASQRVFTPVPLPPGFKHTLRLTSSKPLGWVQYEATCPVHDCVRTADRVGKVAEFFRAHSQCKEEWRTYAQRPAEAHNDYCERLRDTFNFQKDPPPDSISTTVTGNQAPAGAASRPPAGPRSLPGSTQPWPAQPAAEARAPLSALTPRPRPDSPPPAPPDSYKAAFKRRDSSLAPAFDPPQGAIAWPTRSSSPSGVNGVRGDADQLARKRKIEAITDTLASGSGGPANAQRDPHATRQNSEPPGSGQPRDARQAAAEQRTLVGNAIEEARKRLRMEMARYRQEAAGNPSATQVDGPARAVPRGAGQRAPEPSRPPADRLGPGGAIAAARAAPAGSMAERQASGGGLGSAAAEPVKPREEASRWRDGREARVEWDGAGLFPRPTELAYLSLKLACAAPSSVLLLTGPPSSGKSCLLEQVRSSWTVEEEKRMQASGDPRRTCPAPWLQFDCHTAAASAPHFARSLKAAVAEFAHRQGAAAGSLPKIRVRDHHGYVEPDQWRPVPGGDDDLGECLDSLGRWWQDLRSPGRRVACLALDSAHKLRAAPWAPQVVDALEQFSRQGVHVVLVSSDSTFTGWLADVGASAEVETIGNLPPSAARDFFEGLLKRQAGDGASQPVSLDRDWQEIHRVCGGNLGLLKHCLQSAISYNGVQPALKSIWREAGAKVRQGLEVSVKKGEVGYNKEHYSAAVSAILDSPFRAVSATELENRLAPGGGATLRALAAAGLLALREPSNLAADIPPAAYGPLEDRLATLPSAAHAYFWSLLSKASVDALNGGVC